MEELLKFQSSTFDTLTSQKFIEDQNTIMELSGRLQELQNEVNCMNDSKDFQDAESVRSGNSHVTSQPMLFPKHLAFEGLLRPPFVSPRRKEGPPDIWDTFGFFRKRFCKSTSFLFSSLSSRIELSLEEIKIWDASLDRQPKIQSSSVEANNDCRFRISILTSSPRQQPLLAGR